MARGGEQDGSGEDIVTFPRTLHGDRHLRSTHHLPGAFHRHLAGNGSVVRTVPGFPMRKLRLRKVSQPAGGRARNPRWLLLCVNSTGLRQAQRAGKTLFPAVFVSTTLGKIPFA